MVVAATLRNLIVAQDGVRDVVHVRDGGLNARVEHVDLLLRYPFGFLEELLLFRCVRWTDRLVVLLHAAQTHLRRLLCEPLEAVSVELLHAGERTFD